jgi:plastocyanin
VNDSTIDLIDVAMGDNFFNPTDITIVSGDTVRWTMTTSVPHTSTCDGTNGTELPSGAAAWDSGVLFNPGESYKVKLTVPGRYKYYCVVHGISMAGIIVVKPRCQ